MFKNTSKIIQINMPNPEINKESLFVVIRHNQYLYRTNSNDYYNSNYFSSLYEHVR